MYVLSLEDLHVESFAVEDPSVNLLAPEEDSCAERCGSEPAPPPVSKFCTPGCC
jgi:hypothetical protein